MARGRAGRHGHVCNRDHHQHVQVQSRPLHEARGRNRTRHGLPAGRLPPNRQQPGARGQAASGLRLRSGLRHRRARNLAVRSQKDVAALRNERRARGLLHTGRRPRQSRGRDDRARKGCPDGRRPDPGGDRGHGNRAGEWSRDRCLHGARKHRGGIRRQLRRHVGARDRSDGRRQCAIARRRALLPDHRTHRGHSPRFADRRRPRSLRVFPRRSRWKAHGRHVRTGGGAMGDGRHPEEFQLSRRTLGSISFSADRRASHRT